MTPAPGREVELHQAREFLHDETPGVAVLALVGAEGIGKSHLWRTCLQAAEVPAGRLLHSRAAADESAMSHVVLTDLLAQVKPEQLATLPGPQRRALEVVMLRRHPSPLEPHDRHAVGLAVRALFAGMAADGRFVLAIDDVADMDPETAAVLTFAMRRLEHQPVRVLLTAPDERDVTRLVEPWQAHGCRVLRLDPLPVDAFQALIGGHRAELLFPRRVSRLHTAVGGNPALALAILERLEEHASSAGRLDRFPVPARIEDRLGAALVDLPPDVVDALTVTAALSRPSVDSVAAVLGSQQAAVCLGAAAGEGLVELSDRRVRFLDPLMPSLLYHRLSGRDRLQLHRRLAAAVERPAERALHLALATRSPHTAVAATVAEAAADEDRRGEHDAAAELAVEAVRLTRDEDAALLHERVQLAASALVASGDIAHAATLLEHTVGRDIPSDVRAELLLFLARLRSHTDHAAAAAHLLRLAMAETSDVAMQRQAATELAGVFVQLGYLHEAEDELASTGDAGTAPRITLPRLWLDFAEGRLDEAQLRAVVEGPDRLLPFAAQPEYLRGVVDLAAGRLDPARRVLEELHRRSALSGDDLAAGHVLCHLSELERITGNVQMALQYADAACTLARRTGQRVLLAFALARSSLALARLGRLDEARAAAQEGVAIAGATGARRADWLNRWALGFSALSEGDHEAAGRLLVPVTEESYKAGFADPSYLRWVPDAVEALVNIGDEAVANQLLEPFAESSDRLGRAWAIVLAERSRALVLGQGKDRAKAIAVIDHALSGFTAAVDPFELARTMLVAGLLHRRQRHEAQAGRLLQGALELFEQLGAQTWATRLRHDLTVVPPADARPLTPVELRVAELAATGMTNRQIASQMFISPKTVETHLSSVYRKLGIRSRAGLAHQLEGTGTSPTASG